MTGQPGKAVKDCLRASTALVFSSSATLLKDLRYAKRKFLFGKAMGFQIKNNPPAVNSVYNVSSYRKTVISTPLIRKTRAFFIKEIISNRLSPGRKRHAQFFFRIRVRKLTAVFIQAIIFRDIPLRPYINGIHSSLTQRFRQFQLF
ncbi:MAG: hypothetical protein V8S08_01980 [Lachnoclostridium sp.]